MRRPRRSPEGKNPFPDISDERIFWPGELDLMQSMLKESGRTGRYAKAEKRTLNRKDRR